MPFPPRASGNPLVRRYDKEPLLSAVPSVSGTAAITFQVQALAASGTETFSGILAETFKVPPLAASGAELFTGTAAIAFGAPGLHSDVPIELAIDEPHRYPYRHVQPLPPRPIEIPFHVRIEPTVVPYQPRASEVAPVPAVAIDRRMVIIALFAAGAIDEAEFTAMMAA